MFNIGPLELLAILVIALLVVGPEELPRAARKVAGFVGELRRQGEEVRSQVREMIDDAVSEEDMKTTVESIEKVRSTLSLGDTSTPADSVSSARSERAAGAADTAGADEDGVLGGSSADRPDADRPDKD